MDPHAQQGQVPQAPEPEQGMSTGLKVGIGIAIGCLAAVLAVVLVLLFMGACTCSACSSCCTQMQQAAQQAQELEEKEAARLREVGETVELGYQLSVTISDAQRQGETVVVTADVTNSSYSEVLLGPEMFTLEDSTSTTYDVDMEKASMTMEGIQEDLGLPSEATVTVRAVFTVAQTAKGLVLTVQEPDYGYRKRRFKLGL